MKVDAVSVSFYGRVSLISSFSQIRDTQRYPGAGDAEVWNFCKFCSKFLGRGSQSGTARVSRLLSRVDIWYGFGLLHLQVLRWLGKIVALFPPTIHSNIFSAVDFISFLSCFFLATLHKIGHNLSQKFTIKYLQQKDLLKHKNSPRKSKLLIKILQP